MVMASLESARGDAKSSFAANTTLRATRDAARHQQSEAGIGSNEFELQSRTQNAIPHRQNRTLRCLAPKFNFKNCLAFLQEKDKSDATTEDGVLSSLSKCEREISVAKFLSSQVRHQQNRVVEVSFADRRLLVFEYCDSTHLVEHQVLPFQQSSNHCRKHDTELRAERDWLVGSASDRILSA